LTEEKKKKHISISQIGTIKMCPMRWKYRYIDKIISPPGIALVAGKAFDEAYNLNYGQKINSKTDLPVEQVQQKFSDELTKGAQEMESDEDIKSVPGLKDTVVNGIATFHQEIAPTVQPEAVQVELRVPLDDEFELLGFVDVETKTEIIDNKTAGKYQEGKYRTQLQGYIYMRYKLTGESKSAALHYLVKTKTPKCVVEPVTSITPYQFITEETNAINYIKKLHKDPDLAFKNQDGWHCSPKWCGFYHLCQGK